METRVLWSGRTIPALGLGGWAIGGPFFRGETAIGWGQVDDRESVAAIRWAYDAGIRLFDTAANYGGGHSEAILGEALAGRDDAIVATKFGHIVDPVTQQATGVDHAPGFIRATIETSMRRLRRERLDLVQLHLNDLPIEDAAGVFDTLDELVSAGRVAAYGWSTDFPDRAAFGASRRSFVSVQHVCNLFVPARRMLAVVEKHRLISLNRSPLGMGLLTGKFTDRSILRSDDIRSSTAGWMPYFSGGRPSRDMLLALETVKELLQSDGRTLTQGALAWIWGQSPATIPIPGFKNLAQVKENVGALEHGPLRRETLDAIEAVMDRAEEVDRAY